MKYLQISSHYLRNGTGEGRHLTNATKEANGIILLRLGEMETKRKGETVASQMKKLHFDELSTDLKNCLST